MPRQPLPLDRGELVEWGPDLDRLLLAVHDPIDRHSRLAVAQPLEKPVASRRGWTEHSGDQEQRAHPVPGQCPGLLRGDDEDIRLHQHVRPQEMSAGEASTTPAGCRRR